MRANKIAGKPEEKGRLERATRRWGNNVKIVLKTRA
jgi:hypothetical protein